MYYIAQGREGDKEKARKGKKRYIHTKRLESCFSSVRQSKSRSSNDYHDTHLFQIFLMPLLGIVCNRPLAFLRPLHDPPPSSSRMA